MSKVDSGDLIKIPYKKGIHTYGRILADGSYAFYDCPTPKERDDFSELIKPDILFIARVNTYAVSKGLWPILINIPLEGSLQNYYPVYFNPAPTDLKNIEFYKSNVSEIEEAIKKDWIKTRIQIGGIHDMTHIESRINDYYDGKMNEFNQRSIFVFKKILGLS